MSLEPDWIRVKPDLSERHTRRINLPKGDVYDVAFQDDNTAIVTKLPPSYWSMDGLELVIGQDKKYPFPIPEVIHVQCR